jgi:hypothetical protein
MSVGTQVALSIFSLGHGSMVAGLVGNLHNCREVGRLIITKNILKLMRHPHDERVAVWCNTEPKNHGANAKR